jgi:eukaryotic-like serine/threonine-protein kinase
VTGNGTANKRIKRCPACKREYPPAEVVCAVDGTILMAVTKDPLLGATLAEKYLVMSEIGRGGMSIVYKGKHTLMDRIVAIKMLISQLVEDQTSTKRFQQEAQAVSLLAHPNVIGVHDFGIAPSGQPYIVMDFLVGESLADVIKRDTSVTEARAVPIFKQACDALDHAHKKGIIHRDLKSSNIMLVEEEGKRDIVKVVDFGIAKLMPSSGKQSQNLTQTGEIFGSPIYMSPEQCLGQPLDARSDIYSMGVLMFETLTGLPPLMGHTIVETMQKHVGTKPELMAKAKPDGRYSPEIEAIVAKSLAKSADDRFQSMQSLSEALDALIQRSASGDIRRTGNQLQALEQVESEPDNLLGSQTSRSTLSKVPRARLTTTGRPTSVSRYGMRAYPAGDGETQQQKISTSSASRSTSQPPSPEKKGLPLPILIGAGVLVLFIGVIVFFLTHPH